MPDDFDTGYQQYAQQQKAPSDNFNEGYKNFAQQQQTPQSQKGGISWLEGPQAFAGNIIPGAAEIPEQLTNLWQYGVRHPSLSMPYYNPLGGEEQPFITQEGAQDTLPDISAPINALNRMFGAPQQPYLDITSQMRKPFEEVSRRHPYAALAGDIAGALPAAMLTGEATALGKIPQIAKAAPWLKAALTGAEYGAAQQGLEETGEQIKSNDQLQLDKLLQAEAQGAAGGAAFGLAGHGLTKLIPKKAPIMLPPEPKLLTYGNVPLIPPSPAQRLRERGEQLFNAPPQAPEEIPILKGKIEKREALPATWREPREEAAKPAPGELAGALKPVAQAKDALDRAAAKLEGALREIDPALITRPYKTNKYISPENYHKLAMYMREKGIVVKEKQEPVVESTMATADQYLPIYKFRTNNPEQEIKELTEDFLKARFKYQNIKQKAAKYLAINETYSVNIKDAEGNTRTINIKHRQFAKPGGYEFPGGTPQEKLEAQSAFNEFKAQLQQTHSRTFVEKFDGFKNKALQASQKLSPELKTWFKGLPSSTQAKIIIGFALAATALYGNEQQAEAAPNFSSVISKLAKGGFKEWMGSRPITHALQAEFTSDMIRKGNKAFSDIRTAYLSKLKRANVRGDTAEQERLHDAYRGFLKKEIAKLDAAGIKGTHRGAQQRYRRALDIDAQDMGLNIGYSPLGAHSEGLDKLTGEVMQSIFLGNTRVAALHVGEAIVASASKYPKAFAQIIANLKDPVYRRFIEKNSPKGMFQQFLEGQKGFGYREAINKAINEPIDNTIKKYLGEGIYQTLSAQLPERAKLGFNSAVIAQDLAKDYPGGPRQYMSDWLANAEHSTPIPEPRKLAFAKTALKATTEENIAVANMPEGLLKERSALQRNQAFAFIFPYTRGALQQTRFFASLADDFLAAVASGDKEATLHAMKGLIIGSLLVGSVAGSSAVPAYIWASLEQIDRAAYGTTDDVNALKDIIDNAQKHVAGGYQMQKFGVKGFAVTEMPQIAIKGVWDQAIRELGHPKNKEDLGKAVAYTATVAFLSRIGPMGLINASYMAERIKDGLEGERRFRRYEQSPAGQIVNTLLGRPYAPKLVDKRIPYNLREGLSHALLDIENPEEVKATREAQIKSEKNWRRDIGKLQRNYSRALAK
jgi:hypothetical protein